MLQLKGRAKLKTALRAAHSLTFKAKPLDLLFFGKQLSLARVDFVPT
jgi:hypothetical protein